MDRRFIPMLEFLVVEHIRGVLVVVQAHQLVFGIVRATIHHIDDSLAVRLDLHLHVASVYAARYTDAIISLRGTRHGNLFLDHKDMRGEADFADLTLTSQLKHLRIFAGSRLYQVIKVVSSEPVCRIIRESVLEAAGTGVNARKDLGDSHVHGANVFSNYYTPRISKRQEFLLHSTV